MNNVKPRVGQLESDVGTLGTKVDQHTQSISGLSTEVNGLKTSKQDKLIAGSGITIDADGKTISSNYAPQRIVTEGKNLVFNDFQDFMLNAEIGERFECWFKASLDNPTVEDVLFQMGGVSKSFVKFGDASANLNLKLLSPIIMSDIRTVNNLEFRTFYCENALVNYKQPTSPNYMTDEGSLSLTMCKQSGTLCGYLKSAYVSQPERIFQTISGGLTNLIQDNDVFSVRYKN